MSLIRWNPARELAAWPSDLFGIQREMNRMFDGFFNRGLQDGDSALTAWTPAVDIAERDDEYLVKVELPGVNKDEVKRNRRRRLRRKIITVLNGVTAPSRGPLLFRQR
jgi:hypothetical protein